MLRLGDMTTRICGLDKEVVMPDAEQSVGKIVSFMLRRRVCLTGLGIWCESIIEFCLGTGILV